MRVPVLVLIASSVGLSACTSTPTTPASGSGGAAALPLALTCPASMATSSGATSVALTYAPPASTGGRLPVTTACSPASGSSFGRGATTVSCTATDSAGATASCTFMVTVTAAPLLKGTRFMAFGDSFTAGEILDASRVKVVNAAKSYPTQLYNLLVARYTAQPITMSNRGESGELLTYRADDGSAQRSEETRLRYGSALTVDKPDAVLLLEGVNDLNTANTDDDIVAVLGQMVREAYGAGAKAVFVATLPPQIPGLLRSGNAARVPGFNAKVKAMAAAENATPVDVYAAMIGNVSALINSEDGLHPLPAGYVVMAETFFAAIRQTFEAPASVTTVRR